MSVQKNLSKQGRGKLLLFSAGVLLAFGFICAMQFINAKGNTVLFVTALLGMHCGVLCFILSKKLKRLKTHIDAQLKKNYLVEYGLLALYLPVMGLKVAGAPVSPEQLRLITLIITALSAAASVVNIGGLYGKLKSATED